MNRYIHIMTLCMVRDTIHQTIRCGWNRQTLLKWERYNSQCVVGLMVSVISSLRYNNLKIKARKIVNLLFLPIVLLLLICVWVASPSINAIKTESFKWLIGKLTMNWSFIAFSCIIPLLYKIQQHVDLIFLKYHRKHTHGT